MDDDHVPRAKFRHGQIIIQLRLTWGVNVARAADAGSFEGPLSRRVISPDWTLQK